MFTQSIRILEYSTYTRRPHFNLHFFSQSVEYTLYLRRFRCVVFHQLFFLILSSFLYAFFLLQSIPKRFKWRSLIKTRLNKLNFDWKYSHDNLVNFVSMWINGALWWFFYASLYNVVFVCNYGKCSFHNTKFETNAKLFVPSDVYIYLETDRQIELSSKKMNNRIS